MNNKKANQLSYVTFIIGICFLFTGSGYLTWLYHLMTVVSENHKVVSVDLLSEVVGYLFQASGLSICSYIFYKNKVTVSLHKAMTVLLPLDLLFLILSVINSSFSLTLVFGYLMNLIHGAIAAVYLFMLTQRIPHNRRGIVFGAGYAIGSVGSWLFSLIGNGNFLRTNLSLIVYSLFVIATLVVMIFTDDNVTSVCEENDSVFKSLPFSGIVFFSILVILFSTVKGAGFYFPMADISSGNVSLEFSRVFYGMGLIIAGYITDKSRNLMLVCCMAGLVTPFILITLSQNVSASLYFWIVSYTLTGFYVVLRVVLFADIAMQNNTQEKNMTFLSCFGLIMGRIGDALSSFLGIVLNNNTSLLVIISGALYVATIIVAYKCFTFVSTKQLENKEVINIDYYDSFVKKYMISSRESEVLKVVIDGKTNSEIAAFLYVSESTVKFHIKNILKKTNCNNRHSLIELYQSECNVA